MVREKTSAHKFTIIRTFEMKRALKEKYIHDFIKLVVSKIVRHHISFQNQR